jgi:hypothetical protein
MQKTLLLALGIVLATWMNGMGQTPAYRLKAWSGDSAAMLQLSEAFMFGKNVEKNEDSAKFYVKKAADKGLADAQFLFGTELLVDVFSSANYAKGVAMLKKAADQGHVDAQYRLSEVHRSKGRGNVSDTYYDIKKAYAYAEMAVKQGLPEALMYCAEARIAGTGTTKNDSIACAFFRRSSAWETCILKAASPSRWSRSLLSNGTARPSPSAMRTLIKKASPNTAFTMSIPFSRRSKTPISNPILPCPMACSATKFVRHFS